MRGRGMHYLGVVKFHGKPTFYWLCGNCLLYAKICVCSKQDLRHYQHRVRKATTRRHNKGRR